MLYGSNGRGVHPRLRSSSARGYPLDETSGDGIDILGSGDDLGSFLAGNVPAFVVSDVGGRARRFDSTNSECLSADPTSLLPVFTSNSWTLTTRVRWLATQDRYLFWFGGDSNLETSAENLLFTVIQNSADGTYTILTENGSGVNQTHNFSSFSQVENVPHTLTFRARPGAVSGVRYDLFVNGHLVETSPDLVQPTGGANSVFLLGAGYDTGAATLFADVDIANCFIYNEALDTEQIEDDARRLHLLPLHSQVQTKVEVEDQSAGVVNLSDLQGLDWVDSFSVSDSSDDPLRTATIDLMREQENLSLAYLKTDTKLNLTNVADPTSYDPLIDVMRDVECFAARLPLFIDADPADWISVFDGIIDAVDWSGEKVTLNCRDNGARLVDTYIETENDFGVGATQTLEDTIQQILDDNDSSTVTDSYPPVTLFSPVASQWILEIQNADGLQLKQRREPVASATRNLAGQIGWEVRYQYDPDPVSGGWKYTLYEPNRLRSDVDILLGPADVENVTQLKVSAQRTRSDVRIVYPSTEPNQPGAVTLPPGISEIDRGWVGVDGKGNGTFAYIHVANTASRARYGRRFFEIAEAAQSQINSINEAARMAGAVCLDLSEPEALYDATMPNLFELQSTDVLKMLQNRVLHTGAQRLSSLAISHDFGPVPKTTARMRGKPSVGFKRWMTLGTYPGQSRPPTIDPFDTLTDQTVGQLVPYITGLIDRSDYFANSTKFQGIKNSNFASSSRGSENPPDSWDAGNFGIVNGWGTYYRYENTFTESGNQSIAVLGTAGAGLNMRSNLTPLPDGDQTSLALEWTEARGNATGNSIVDLQIFWYDSNRSGIGVSSVYNRSNTRPIGDFAKHREEGITPPSNAAFFSVRFDANLTNFHAPHYVDSVNVYPLSPEIAVSNSAAQTNASAPNPVANATWTTLNFDTVGKDYGTGWDAVNMEWTCPQDGSYDLLAGLRAFAPALGNVIDIANVKLQIDTGGGFVDLIVGQGGTFDDGAVNAPVVPAQVALNQYALNKDDKIRAQGYLSYSGGVPVTFGFQSGQSTTFLSIKLRQTE
jgi:hypothetical protein